MTFRPVPPDLEAIAFADDLHGWAGGVRTILATADGGRTWRRVWSGSETVVELTALDRGHVWAVTARQDSEGELHRDRLLRSADGGRTWTSVRLSASLMQLDFTTASLGWAVATKTTYDAAGGLEYTTTGGARWTTIPIGMTGSVCFADRLHGWAVGSRVVATVDGGRTWRQVGSRLPSPWGGLFTLTCAGRVLWLFQTLVGSGAGGHVDYVAYRSTDGGSHWTEVLRNRFYPAPRQQRSVASADDEPGPFVAPDPLTAIEVGVSPASEETSVTITRDGGRHWTTTRLAQVGFGAGPAAFPDTTNGWVLTGGAWPGSTSLVATTDGGRTWRETWPTTHPSPVGDTAFVSPSHGYGVGIPGDPRAVLETTNGGQAWSQIKELPEPASLLRATPGALSFGDAAHGWLVVQSGHLLATTDGARTWHRLSFPKDVVAIDEAALGPAGRGCIIGYDPTGFGAPVAYATSDDGRTWQSTDPTVQAAVCAQGTGAGELADRARQLFADPSAGVPRLVLLDASTAWADMGDGLARTTDGGLSWRRVPWPNAGDGTNDGGTSSVSAFDGPWDISFVNASDGWMLGTRGGLFRTTDGGLSWTQLP